MTKEHHHPLERIKRKKNCHWGTSIHCKVCRDQAFEGFCHNMIKYPSHTLFYIWYLICSFSDKNFLINNQQQFMLQVFWISHDLSQEIFSHNNTSWREEKNPCVQDTLPIENKGDLLIITIFNLDDLCCTKYMYMY